MKKSFMINRFRYAAAVIGVFLVSFINKIIVQSGQDWYNFINLPAYIPNIKSNRIILSIIFILIFLSIFFFLRNNKENKEIHYQAILIFFLTNGILNIFCFTLFFAWNLIFWSIWGIVFLNLSTLTLIILLAKNNKLSSILLIPYFLGGVGISYVLYNIYLIN